MTTLRSFCLAGRKNRGGSANSHWVNRPWEHWDDSVQSDVVNLLQQMIPPGVWLHDQQDGNGDSHLKAGLVGPSETIPVVDSRLGLSRWQNVFLCEFDGPRRERRIMCTVLNSDG